MVIGVHGVHSVLVQKHVMKVKEQNIDNVIHQLQVVVEKIVLEMLLLLKNVSKLFVHVSYFQLSIVMQESFVNAIRYAN